MSIRLRQICLVTNQLAPTIEDFNAILGLEVCFVDKGVAVFGLENSLMPIGSISSKWLPRSRRTPPRAAT
jgi:hypothetical protein